MYDRILVPTDGSEAAEAAVEHAVRLARAFESTLHVLYVVDTEAIGVALGAEGVDRVRTGGIEELEGVDERARAAIDQVVVSAETAGVPVEPAIEPGVPHRAIPRFADEQDVDLVVMGSHGRSGIRRALLGSVTERVTRTTSLPVLVADPRER